jgi:hypothetical protein
MFSFDHVWGLIQEGTIQIPESFKQLPQNELKQLVEPILNYVSDHPRLKERSRRIELLKFTHIFLGDEDFTVLLVNLSMTGALVMVNTENQKITTSEPGEILIQVSKFLDEGDYSDLRIKFRFVRQAEGRGAYDFMGLQFLELNESQLDLLSTILQNYKGE